MKQANAGGIGGLQKVDDSHNTLHDHSVHMCACAQSIACCPLTPKQPFCVVMMMGAKKVETHDSESALGMAGRHLSKLGSLPGSCHIHRPAQTAGALPLGSIAVLPGRSELQSQTGPASAHDNQIVN